ncbi:MAG: alkaline phosphatase family protein [Bryobacterales bacterium]|nr:alkaline phosphatase family protein [Bryobacterales bacterium]
MQLPIPAVLVFFIFTALSALAQPSRHVVVISIDGFAAYALKDPTLPIPNIRRLIASGAVADSVQPVNPTVTWPNHTSIVTGVTPSRHSVLYNGQAQRTGEGKPLKVEPWIDKKELVAGDTVYDLAHRAQLTTAEVDWVAIQNPGTITYSFAEVPSAEAQIPKEMIAAGLITADEVTRFGKLPIHYRDEMWTRAGEHIITRHKPNLLLFHLLTTDSLQHAHGARSVAGYTALAYADHKVGRLLDALRRAGIYNRTTVIIVSDHGFKTVKQNIQPNAILASNGLGDAAWSIPEGGTAMVYVTRTAGKSETIARMQEIFKTVPGVTKVLTPADFPQWGYPTPSANPRMADLVLAAADGYAFGGATSGPPVSPVPAGATPGTHGYLNDDPDIQAIFVASGAGIRPGVKVGAIRNLDVAPTIARLLKLQMNGVEGRVLTEILPEPAK